MFLSTLNVRSGVCMCAYTNTLPEEGREGEGVRAHIHIPRKAFWWEEKKKIALYQAEIKWISATAEWLGNSIHFNALWAVIPIFIQRHWVSQERFEKSIQHFLYFHIFFWVYFWPLKWYCCKLAGITQISSPLVFCLYILFIGRTDSNPWT